MWIVCQADSLHEMSRCILTKNIKKTNKQTNKAFRMSSAWHLKSENVPTAENRFMNNQSTESTFWYKCLLDLLWNHC